MQSAEDKIAMIRKLQARVDAMQGLGKTAGNSIRSGFDPFADAFPEGIFPASAVHQFISYTPTEASATTGFITAMSGRFLKDGGLCLWIGDDQRVFAPGLVHFGVQPDRIIFIDVRRQKDALWMLEEALKCDGLTTVVGELQHLDFTASRRLQLAVEQSGITGFIHCHRPRSENAVACTSRWKISQLAGKSHEALPGVIFNAWDVQLLKVRNGRPCSWQIRWAQNTFVQATVVDQPMVIQTERQTG